MQMDESIEECARRELQEETGLVINTVEQFHIFSDVNRDPQERVLTVAHYALVRLADVEGGDDAARGCFWMPTHQINGKLALFVNIC